MERALEGADYLIESQRRNVRLKARDLEEGRLTWESVPFRIQIESNRRCNTSCMHCDIERAGTGELSVRVVESLLDEVGWGSLEIMPFVGGEPTLARMEVLAPLVRRHNNFLNFTTNGFLFTGEYFQAIADITARVHFSLNSPRRDVDMRIMPGLDFDQRVRNLRDTARMAKSTGAQVLAGLVVMDCNLEDLERFVHFVADLGVERVIFQKLYPASKLFSRESVEVRRSPDEVAEHVGRALDAALELGVFVETNLDQIFGDRRNQNPRSSRFDFLQDNSHIVELFRPGFCIATANSVLIEWDGTVIPCCRDHYVLGNLNDSSFQELWNGERMKRLRSSLFDRELRPHCRRCMDFYNGHA